MPGIADTLLSVTMVLAPTIGYFDQVIPTLPTKKKFEFLIYFPISTDSF